MNRGYSVYFDVQEHEPGCATIVKTPAATDIVGCGRARAYFKQPACALLELESTFMIQSCCGDDCKSAGGGKMIRGIGQMGTARSILLDGRGGLLLQYANGTIIEPAEVAPPSALVNAKTMKRQDTTEQRLQKRGCTKNSWKGGKVLTKPADNVQIVYESSVTGPGSVSITQERTQSWSTSMSIGIADVLSLGISAEFSESVSSSKEVTVSFAAGQTGRIGFTAILSCSTGKGQCDDGEVEGEVCCKHIFLRALKLQSN